MLDFLLALRRRGAAAVAQPPCFHCGLPVPPDCREAVVFEGTARSVCCTACASVMQSIIDCGAAHIYRQRASAAAAPVAAPAAAAEGARLGG